MANHDSHDDAPDALATELAQPITSRFLFVDVAAQRAKQLRRGALPRLERGTVTTGPSQARTRRDGRSPHGRHPLHAADQLRGRHSQRHEGIALLTGVLGTVEGLVVSTVSLLVLFIGFVLLFNLPKLRTGGRHSKVVRSLDDLVGDARPYLAPGRPAWDRRPASDTRNFSKRLGVILLRHAVPAAGSER